MDEGLRSLLRTLESIGLERGVHACYILTSLTSKRTYCGYTNFFTRRLRQHNRELVGGARYTHNRGPWTPLAVLFNLRNKQEGLKLEWWLKHPRMPGGKKLKGSGKRWRMNAIHSMCGNAALAQKYWQQTVVEPRTKRCAAFFNQKLTSPELCRDLSKQGWLVYFVR